MPKKLGSYIRNQLTSAPIYNNMLKISCKINGQLYGITYLYIVLGDEVTIKLWPHHQAKLLKAADVITNLKLRVL